MGVAVEGEPHPALERAERLGLASPQRGFAGRTVGADCLDEQRTELRLAEVELRQHRDKVMLHRLAVGHAGRVGALELEGARALAEMTASAGVHQDGLNTSGEDAHRLGGQLDARRLALCRRRWRLWRRPGRLLGVAGRLLQVLQQSLALSVTGPQLDRRLDLDEGLVAQPLKMAPASESQALIGVVEVGAVTPERERLFPGGAQPGNMIARHPGHTKRAAYPVLIADLVDVAFKGAVVVQNEDLAGLGLVRSRRPDDPSDDEPAQE